MKSIRRSLVLWSAASLGLLVLGGGLLVHAQVERTLRAERQGALGMVAAAIAGQVEWEDGTWKFEANDRLPPECSRSDGAFGFVVWRPDGAILARSPSVSGWQPERPPVGAQPRFFEFDRPQHAAGLACALPVHAGDGADHGDCTLLVVADARALYDTLAFLRTALASTALVMLLLGGALVAFYSRRALAPIDRLAAQLARMDADQLDEPVALERAPAELRGIVARLEELRSRLAASFARERGFNAAVAHELRTPLAELRAAAEVALKWPEADASLRALRETLAITVQMERLVGTLLAIHRAERAQPSTELSPERVDLKQLLDEVLRALAATAPQRADRVDLDGVTGAVVADRGLLKSIVSNLVDNAFAHSPEPSTVVCRVGGEGGRYFEIANPAAADALAPDLEQLFAPFWRADKSRADPVHAGLGLTLARVYARLLGLDITLRYAGGVFTARLGPFRDAGAG